MVFISEIAQNKNPENPEVGFLNFEVLKVKA